MITMEIGKFTAHITIMCCGACRETYYPDEVRRLVPTQGNIGFDVMVYVGKQLFLENCNDFEVKSLLEGKNISISLREIGFLGKKFLTYLMIAHVESSDKIKHYIQRQGGYILHIDGTCEGGSPHLFSSIDSISGIVLHNIKVPSENSKYLIPFLKDIESRYGIPIAVVSDLSPAIISSVEMVFPGVNIFVCHFHFLRDIGNDLMRQAYNSIREFLSEHKIYAALRKIVRELKCVIDENEEFKVELENSLKNQQWVNSIDKLPAVVSTYLLVAWVLEAKQESNGYGIPFDLPHVYFYKRLMEAYPTIEKLQGELIANSIKFPMSEILRVHRDIALKESVFLIDEKTSLFNKLRKAMRITLNTGKDGLNDEGGSDIKSIEKSVKEFRNSEQLKTLTDAVARKKMEKQIDKYWSKLFSDPISVVTEDGVIQITPQRTNNSMERFFRRLKRAWRKKSGTASLSKIMNSMSPNIALVCNLKNPDYVKNILNGSGSLAERFSAINHQLVLEEMCKENEVARKYHKGMGRLFKIQQLPKIIHENVINYVTAE